MAVLLDSSFVIDLLRSSRPALRVAAELEASGGAILLPTPTLFEVRTGLLRPGGMRQARKFESLAAAFPSLAFDAAAAERAAEVRIEMLARGTPLASVDLMLAGMALVGGHELVSRDDDYEHVVEAFGLRLRKYA